MDAGSAASTGGRVSPEGRHQGAPVVITGELLQCALSMRSSPSPGPTISIRAVQHVRAVPVQNTYVLSMAQNHKTSSSYLDESSPGSAPGCNIQEDRSRRTRTTTPGPCPLSINTPCDHIYASCAASTHASTLPGADTKLAIKCSITAVQALRNSILDSELCTCGLHPYCLSCLPVLRVSLQIFALYCIHNVISLQKRLEISLKMAKES